MLDGEIDRLVRAARQFGSAALLALLVGIGVPAAAQNGVSPTSAPAQTPTPEVVPPSRIAESIDAARDQLRRLQLVLVPTDRIRVIENDLSAVLKSVNGLSQRTSREVTAGSPGGLPVLADIDGQWRGWKDRLQEWQRTLSARAEEVDGVVVDVQKLRDDWVATRKSAARNDTPSELLKRIDDGLASFDEILSQARSLRSDLLTLQGRVAQAQTHVDEGIAQVAAMREEQQRLLWVSEEPPLWTALRLPAPDSAGRGGLMTGQQQIGALADFAATKGLTLVFELLLFVILVVLLRWLHVQARGGGGRKPLASAQRILRRPLSASMMISLLLFRTIQPLAPAVANQLVALLFVVPVVRLLPRALFSRMRPEVLALSGLFALSHVLVLVPTQSFVQRMLLLLETVLSAAVFAMIFVRDRAGRSAGRPHWNLARPLAVAATPLLLASVTANLFGNVLLARLLTSAVIDTSYTAFALFAAAMVLDGLFGALLYQPLAQRLHMVRHHGAWLRQRVINTCYFVLSLAWLSVALSWFGIEERLLDIVGKVLDIAVSVGSLNVTLGGVVRFGVTLWVAALMARAARFLLEEDILPRTSLSPGAAIAVITSVRYLAMATGFVVAVVAAGVDFSNVAILAGALSVGIGFGLQNVVNNFVSSLILLVERPVTVGDTVEIGTTSGTVRRIGIRSSTIRTFDGADVILPNGNLISDRVVNWTFSDRFRRIEVNVGVAYGSDPRRVIALLVDAAARHPGSLMYPKPAAFFMGFGDSSLNFSLRFWTGNFDDWVQIRSDVAIAINDALNEAGIEIPFPQSDVHLKTPAPPSAAPPPSSGPAAKDSD